MATVHVRLPELRARRRLSQRQLASLAGVRPDTISALERGASAGIRFETLAGICDVLGCEPGELFEIEHDDHQVPVLGGPDEDVLVDARLREPGRRIDGASFMAELLNSPPAGAAGHHRRPR